MILACVKKLWQKNRQNERVVRQWSLGYVEAFSWPKRSLRIFYHRFWVPWTWPKSHFRRLAFLKWQTSDAPRSTHLEPLSMLRRLVWWWTSPMVCMQLLWAVLCHYRALNASFRCPNTSDCSQMSHIGDLSQKACFFWNCSQKSGFQLFNFKFFSSSCKHRGEPEMHFSAAISTFYDLTPNPWSLNFLEKHDKTWFFSKMTLGKSKIFPRKNLKKIFRRIFIFFQCHTM